MGPIRASLLRVNASETSGSLPPPPKLVRLVRLVKLVRLVRLVRLVKLVRLVRLVRLVFELTVCSFFLFVTLLGDADFNKFFS
jgi:hypothetical protein